MGQIPYEELEQVMALVFPEDFSVDGGHFSIKEQTGGPFTPGQGFTEVFGSVPEGLEELGRLTEAPNVDGLFENLMISDGHVYGIDYEWVFDMEIPAKFLHYRNLLYFLPQVRGFGLFRPGGAFRPLWHRQKRSRGFLPPWRSTSRGMSMETAVSST